MRQGQAQAQAELQLEENAEEECWSSAQIPTRYCCCPAAVAVEVAVDRAAAEGGTDFESKVIAAVAVAQLRGQLRSETAAVVVSAEEAVDECVRRER